MKTNIVLIGMTGSGKTSFGKALSQRLNFPFLDIDEEIERTTQQTIPELFAVSEDHFRTIETTVSKKIAADYQYTVISCGGGVVLKAENIRALKQTGWIILIDRPVENIIQDIQTAHRPLLKFGSEKLYQLHKERIDLYHHAADFVVQNRSSESYVLQKIEENLPDTIKRRQP
ncbi:shikimate kinase [Marinilactibacillus kalidii]|uniref:shikimate kinase n=1 Tax=Marinilactibacillus kalidii TaxID=2820274 RepID=UPI001ABDDD14|nr:shikimate kinase [Marinilactibacillus kalidii]